MKPPPTSTQASRAQLLAAVQAQLDLREAADLKASFHKFVQKFWHVAEPRYKFEDNWHIQMICKLLEEVQQGLQTRVIINVPPGTSKSTLVSVMFPAWVWAQQATSRFLGTSYSEDLCFRDTRLCRDIIADPEYQRLFPHVAIKKDEDATRHYATHEGGWRDATTVGGRGTGLHPNYILIDDPHNVRQADSDQKREDALNWFSGTISTRGIMHGAAIIIVMQRLHARDLTGYIMASTTYKEWTHIVVPMEYETSRLPSTTWHGFKDPRTAEGELMWPSKFTAAKVASLKSSLGEYGSAGQLAQRPAPPGGGILKVDNFKLWSADEPLPDLFAVIQSYDTAHTEKTSNDPTACTTWGIFEIKGVPCALLLDAWDEHMAYPDLREKVLDDWKAEYGGRKQPNGIADPKHPPRRPDILLVEEKGSGISLLQDLRLGNVPAIGYNPGRADKRARGHLSAPFLEMGMFHVLESRKDRGKPVTWARAFLRQCEEFPNSEHDDYVDTFTQFVIYARDAHMLELRHLPEDPIEEIDYHAQHQRGNPYGGGQRRLTSAYSRS